MDDDLGTVRWFGTPWPSPETPAPVCDDPRAQVPAPVGEECLWCDEAITEADSGVTMPLIRASGREGVAAYHKECNLRTVIGPVSFLEGRCRHADPPGTDPCHDRHLTKRQDALASWQWLHDHGTLS